MMDTASIDHREVGLQLAELSRVEISSARPRTVRLWEARGLALMALANGRKDEAGRIMPPHKRKGACNGSG